MNDISVNQPGASPLSFSFDGIGIRALTLGGEPWFVARDLCEVLAIANSRMAVDRLDDDEKGVSSIDTPHGAQNMNIVSESGMYSLILGSRKPEAKRFKKWVTAEVLPQIRRTGSYTAIPRSFAEALRLAAEQAERIEQQQALIERQKPAVEFVGKYVEASTGSKTFREVCKLLKVKEPAFRAFLKDRGVMYQIGGAWVPYADHIDAGRFEVKTGAADNGHAFTSSRFTAKGVEWIAGEWAKHQVREAA